MDTCQTKYGPMAYELAGSGETALVIDAAICSGAAEWRHIARVFAGSCRVLTFDRKGYGASPSGGLPPTPENRARELRALLDALDIRQDILLLGHSQGGLYAVQYALLYPEAVRGLVLLDPATPFDGEFKARLTPQEYSSSGVDKTAGYRLGRLLTSLGLGFAFRPLLTKSPPFCYHTFEPEAEREMLRMLTRPQTYRTALDEYRYTHDGANMRVVAQRISSGSLGATPLRLITHSEAFYTQELKRYAGMDDATARNVESAWQQIMLRYLGLSRDARHVTAPQSGHHIHLTDFETVRCAVLELQTV